MRKDLINKIDNFLGKLFFSSFSSLRYCLFDFIIYHKNLKNKLRENKKIVNFNDNGFSKLNPIKEKSSISKLKEFFKEENNNLKKQNNYTLKLSFQNEENKKLIKKIIKDNFQDTLDELQKYYNANIYLTNVELKKTFHIDKHDLDEEHFNNFFHIDSYLRTHFKIFVNVSDIKLSNGPTEIYDISKTKKIRKFNSFNKERGKLEIPESIESYLNIGNAGEVLLCNTSLCLHRATNPSLENSRENLILTFVAYPNDTNNIYYYEKKDPDSIWTQKNFITKLLAKPKGYKDVFLLSKKFF